MQTFWYQNVGIGTEAANIAAQSGAVDGVIFRLTHPRDERFWPALDAAMEFRAKQPGEVVLGIDLWYAHENRASQFLSDPNVFRENLQLIPCIPGVKTLLDREPYGNLKRMVNATVSPQALKAMLDAVREIGPIFDYGTPATNKLAYPGVPVGDIYRIFLNLAKRQVLQPTYFSDLKDPQKWLDSDPDAVVGIMVHPKGEWRIFKVEDGLKVYPLRDRMIYPAAGQEVACAKLL